MSCYLFSLEGLGLRADSIKDIKGSKDIAETVQPVAPINNPLFHQVNQIGTHPHLSVDSAVKIIDRYVRRFFFF